MTNLNNLPDKVAQRIRKFSNVSQHVVYRNGFLTEVRCKCCRAVLINLIEQDKPIETVRNNGQTIVTKRMILAATAMYAEIEITFDDGSKHVTSLCKDCVAGMSQSKLEEIYVGDLYQWAEEENMPRAQKQNWSLIGERKPKSFVSGN